MELKTLCSYLVLVDDGYEISPCVVDQFYYCFPARYFQCFSVGG